MFTFLIVLKGQKIVILLLSFKGAVLGKILDNCTLFSSCKLSHVPRAEQPAMEPFTSQSQLDSTDSTFSSIISDFSFDYDGIILALPAIVSA